MNKLEEKVTTEQYSFISLYLFVLVFFIILSRVVTSPNPNESIEKFINEIKSISSSFSSSPGASAVNNKLFYDQEKQIDASTRLKAIKDIKLSKKIAWDKVFDEFGEPYEDFQKIVNDAINFAQNDDGTEKDLIFLAGFEDDEKINEKITALTKFLSSIRNIKFLIELEANNSENSLFIQIATRL